MAKSGARVHIGAMAGPLLYMDAVITPNRSLSKRGLAIVLGLMVFYNLVLGVLMLVIGAFPVPIFLGLDVVVDERQPLPRPAQEARHDLVAPAGDVPATEAHQFEGPR